MFRIMWSTALVAAALNAQPPKRILYITHSAGFVHGSIPVSQRVMADTARRTGKIEVFSTEDLSFIAADRLRDFAAVFFFTSGELALSDSQKRDLLAFVRAGNGFGGAHSATDTLYQWPEYGDLIGAYFDGHPWTQTVTIDVEDPDHPATRGLLASFRILDEIYQFREFSRDRVRPLLTLDTSSVNLNAEGVNRPDRDFALAWTRAYGEGRVFYTALGHFDETWLDSRFQRILEGALLWLAGEEPGAGAARRAVPRVTSVSNLARDSAGAVAPGMLTAVSGSSLTAGSSMSASGFPLPLKLAGAEVWLAGTPVPLVSASPGRIVVHLSETPGDALTVRVGPDSSSPTPLRVETAVPGILGISRSGRVLSLYATGLARDSVPEVLVSGTAAVLLFAGPAPGLAGITQVNVTLPAAVAGAYSVKLLSAGKESNTVEGPE